MKHIRVVGLDPSLRNWGIAVATVTFEPAAKVFIEHISTLSPVLPKGKQVRQNSMDLESAKQLCEGILKAVEGANAVFVEVPVGSQSARAMASYGICVGVVGSIRAMGVPLFEVTPTEVKMASVGSKTASKQEMIDWAVSKHPEACWPYYLRKGESLIAAAIAEHQADATAAIYAGLACNTFQQMLSFMKAQR